MHRRVHRNRRTALVWSGQNQHIGEHGYEEGKGAGTGSPASLKAELLSLPQRGGGFAARYYVGAEMAAFCNADSDLMVEPWLAELLASRLQSSARIDSKEYAEVIKRLLLANMAKLIAESSPHPLGMFVVWKEVDRIQRLITDVRPVNEHFTSPPCEFTSGEELSRVQVQLGYILEAANATSATSSIVARQRRSYSDILSCKVFLPRCYGRSADRHRRPG